VLEEQVLCSVAMCAAVVSLCECSSKVVMCVAMCVTKKHQQKEEHKNSHKVPPVAN